jgi:hypothetical protein
MQVNGLLIMGKAIHFAPCLNINSFHCSEGRLYHFKEREGSGIQKA